MGTWEWDIATNSIIWSPEVHKLFGVPEGRFGGHFDAFLDLLEPEDRERAQVSSWPYLSKEIIRGNLRKHRSIRVSQAIVNKTDVCAPALVTGYAARFRKPGRPFPKNL